MKTKILARLIPALAFAFLLPSAGNSQGTCTNTFSDDTMALQAFAGYGTNPIVDDTAQTSTFFIDAVGSINGVVPAGYPSFSFQFSSSYKHCNCTTSADPYMPLNYNTDAPMLTSGYPQCQWTITYYFTGNGNPTSFSTCSAVTSCCATGSEPISTPNVEYGSASLSGS